MIDRQLLIHALGDTPAVVAAALRSARNAVAELGSGDSVHVVVQGPAVRELADGGTLADELEAALLEPRVVVLACQNSLRSADLTSSELRPGVQTVPSAVAYLAERQWQGAAYVRI
jgi:intracellular sulfur oxidation DsrE/DsrF family protein